MNATGKLSLAYLEKARSLDRKTSFPTNESKQGSHLDRSFALLVTAFRDKRLHGSLELRKLDRIDIFIPVNNGRPTSYFTKETKYFIENMEYMIPTEHFVSAVCIKVVNLKFQNVNCSYMCNSSSRTLF